MLPGSSGDMQLNDNQSMYANGDMSSVSINEINDRDHNFIHNQNSGTSAQPPIKIKQEMFYILSDPGASWKDIFFYLQEELFWKQNSHAMEKFCQIYIFFLLLNDCC